VPDERLETALDVMGEMIFAPPSPRWDAEREVVLEEIATYEDRAAGARARPDLRRQPSARIRSAGQ
jgi:hypothetical protein